MEKFEYDDEIRIPDEFDKRIDMSVKRAKRGSYYCRNKSIIATSFLLIFVLVLGMNPDVRAYTTELPIVKNVMKWFKSDESITKLKENKFKIYDLVTQKDGYKLYMKDIYFDEKTFRMKIAVEDENGEAFNIQDWNLNSNHIKDRSSCSYMQKMKNVDPWYDVSSRSNLGKVFDKNNYSYDKVNIKLRMSVSDGNKTIDFNEVEINEENVCETRKPKIIKLNKEYEFDGLKVLIEDLKIYPNRMVVKVNSENNDKVHFIPRMEMKIIDKKGKVYEVNTYSSNCMNSYEFNFLGSVYFDEDNYIQNIDIELEHGKIESMKTIASKNIRYGEQEEFTFNNVLYKVYRERFEKGYDRTYLTFKRSDHNQVHSDYYIKESGEWSNMGTYGNEEDIYIRITKNEIEMNLGKELGQILSSDDNEFYNYAVKFNEYLSSRLEKDREYDIERVKVLMKRINAHNELMIVIDDNIDDTLLYRLDTKISMMWFEFGILDRTRTKKEHIEIELY